MQLLDPRTPATGRANSNADASCEVKPLNWWKRHETDLPNWSRPARQVVLVQPSSAAAERVFSILHCSFGDRQNNALEDYIEASVLYYSIIIVNDVFYYVFLYKNN